MAESIFELATALRSGELTAEALLDRCLERIRRIDPSLNSFVALDEDGGRTAAKASDARFAAGSARSALEGIPLSVKDNILVAGMPATWGSRALAEFVPSHDELPINRLRAAGAVIIGKTNVPELTLEGYTKNDLFGVTRNPWDIRLTPGGSSGGAAAGVAAGLVPAAIGTDGGGSTRRPACHTGLVGWKPSAGHIPRIDGFPAILTDFETIGTLTRSVEDASLLDAAMAGPDARDRRSLCVDARPRPQSKARILFIPQFGDAPVDSEVSTATARVAAELAREGHTVREEGVVFDLDEVARIWHVVSRAGVAWLMSWNGSSLSGKAGAAVRAMAAEGEKLTGADYIDALERVAALRRHCAELFDRVDLILTPTAAALPWLAEKPYPDQIAGRLAGPRDHAVFTGWVNIAGVPAISLPVARSKSGLPIGVQFAASFGADAALLAFARAFSESHPGPSLPVTPRASASAVSPD
jgi:Asp-tRNA(Asn)/Glu-tRNA(Gln) amidotransferase A subunit family amidase